MSRKKIFFLSLSKVNPSTINSNGIYTSLLKRFKESDFDVYILNPIEKRFYKNQSLELEKIAGINYLNVRIGNITKTNIIEKGISTIDIERRYINAIKKHLSDIKFDIVLYPTPPITFYRAIKYLKKRDGAMTYLMLKDIFPQNAVDIGFFSKKSLIYRYFRNKEKKLYEISDYIGCMSEANVDYLLKHNPYLDPKKVEILPNSINPIDISVSEKEKKIIREKYNLPLDKKIFIYGGNLGKPQGIPFLLKCIESVKDIDEILFLIVGNGTEFNYTIETKEKLNLNNLIVMKRIEKSEFNKVLAASDIGILSLDYRFTIPNYPSRFLSYLQANLPVLAITDINSDVGSDIIANNIGWWCNKNSIEEFRKNLLDILKSFNTGHIKNKSINSHNFLKENFDISDYYKVVLEHLRR